MPGRWTRPPGIARGNALERPKDTESARIVLDLRDLSGEELAGLAAATVDVANDARARLRRQMPRPHDTATRDYLDRFAECFAAEIRRWDRVACEAGR